MSPEEKASISIAQKRGNDLVEWLDKTVSLNGEQRTYKEKMYRPWLVQVAKVLVDCMESEDVKLQNAARWKLRNGLDWQATVKRFMAEMKRALKPDTLEVVRGSAKHEEEFDWTGAQFEVTLCMPNRRTPLKAQRTSGRDEEGLVEDWDGQVESTPPPEPREESVLTALSGKFLYNSRKCTLTIGSAVLEQLTKRSRMLRWKPPTMV